MPGKETYSEMAAQIPRYNDVNTGCDEEQERRIENIRNGRKKREKKTLIFSSSITRDINFREFNNKLEMGKADFHVFKGKKARDISRYMISHVEEENPSDVVFVAGGNDLPAEEIASPQFISKVADNIIKGGLSCRYNGVSNIFISSILPRASSYFQLNRMRLNQLLYDECKKHRFIFIDNDSNIVLKHHVLSDTVHLNAQGSKLLQNNLLNALNS